MPSFFPSSGQEGSDATLHKGNVEGLREEILRLVLGLLALRYFWDIKKKKKKVLGGPLDPPRLEPGRNAQPGNSQPPLCKISLEFLKHCLTIYILCSFQADAWVNIATYVNMYICVDFYFASNRHLINTDQPSPAILDTFCTRTVQQGSHQPRVATEHLNCGWYE